MFKQEDKKEDISYLFLILQKRLIFYNQKVLFFFNQNVNKYKAGLGLGLWLGLGLGFLDLCRAMPKF